jgi:hypothetical protein
MSDFRYQIPEGKVAHELIDGEVIVLQFDTGFYFSMSSGAAQVWQWIAEGASWGQIRGAYEPLAPEQAAALDAFGERLAQENLVAKAEGATASTPNLPSGGVRFEPPTMEKYGDMQDLLLADPIHEVDAEGWPKPAEEPGGPKPQGG